LAKILERDRTPNVFSGEKEKNEDWEEDVVSALEEIALTSKEEVLYFSGLVSGAP
jgi:hypothetical protein